MAARITFVVERINGVFGQNDSVKGNAWRCESSYPDCRGPECFPRPNIIRFRTEDPAVDPTAALGKPMRCRGFCAKRLEQAIRQNQCLNRCSGLLFQRFGGRQLGCRITEEQIDRNNTRFQRILAEPESFEKNQTGFLTSPRTADGNDCPVGCIVTTFNSSALIFHFLL